MNAAYFSHLGYWTDEICRNHCRSMVAPSAGWRVGNDARVVCTYFQQLLHRVAAERIGKVRRDFGERNENKPATGEAWMRYDEIGFLNNSSSKKYDVDIERSRPF